MAIAGLQARARILALGKWVAVLALLLPLLVVRTSAANWLAGGAANRQPSITRGDVYIVRLRRAPVAMQVSALDSPSPTDLKFYGALSPDAVSPMSAAFAASVAAASASDAGSGAASSGSGGGTGGSGAGATRRLLTESLPSAERVSARMAQDGDGIARGAGRNRRKLASDWGAVTRNGRPWFDRWSALIQSLVTALEDEQNKVARQAGLTNVTRDILYRYCYISNGFAAVLTAAQADSLRSDSRVLQVVRSRAVQKQTSETPLLLDLPGTFWGASYTGDDAVIGVVDTGVWPEHPSFSEDGYGVFPKTWRGQPADCKRTADFQRCTRKVLQASYFLKAFESQFGAIDTASDWRSPRDADGHGSWVAAAAAGNRDTPMTVARGQTVGKGSGVAPRARIAAYKVFWRNANSQGIVATTADIEQAMDQAVADGCDVILLALGAVDGAQTYFDDLSSLYASMAGTLVVTAAGNGGKGSDSTRTIANFSPFYLTVGASTINRRFSATLTLSNGNVLDVNGLGAGTAAITSVPIVHSPAAKLASADATKADQCAAGTLDKALIAGKLVVCVAGGDVPLTMKVGEAKAKGALGVVLHSSPRTNQPYAKALPVVGVSVLDTDALLAFLKTPNPRASLSPAFTTKRDLIAPVMYAASASGPLSLGATTDVFKPDVVAPGAFIWAAARSATPADDASFRVGSGTSMAAAHVAGVAALLMQRNPTWTPVQVMSAITTSANASMVNKDPLQPDSLSPMAMGAGHVDVDSLFNPGPGLAYNMEVPHFVRFLTGQNAALVGKLLQEGQDVSPIAARDLNRPTIAVSNLQGAVTVSRTVTNLGDVATYTARVVEPAGVDVEVTPASFTIQTGVANAVRFSVKLTPRAGAGGGSGWKFGSLTWVDGAGHAVKSVIAVET
ncbi:hypothetical protein CLOM_g8938 [Closterium sp. NIES-68]|nr:hypothetical protein CLOM_g8938 [Closterium sp. NIES-68]GJP84851.1 hypothetical protein CLOP_g14900 [Closterium sp. NIES-67]